MKKAKRDRKKQEVSKEKRDLANLGPDEINKRKLQKTKGSK